MASPFDDLLGDFGDSFVPVKTGATTSDSGLLLDLTADTEVTNGQTNGMDSSPSANPLYDLTSESSPAGQSSNPLYDLSSNPLYDLSTSTPVGNPLYEMDSQEPGAGHPSNLIMDFSVETNTSASANPLDDLASCAGRQGEDSLYGTNNANAAASGDLLGDFSFEANSSTQQHEQDDTGPQESGSSLFDMGPQESGSSLFDMGPSDQGETTVVTTVREEVAQDGQDNSKTTRSENRYSSGSGFEESSVSNVSSTAPVWEATNSTGNEASMSSLSRSNPIPQAAPRSQPQPQQHKYQPPPANQDVANDEGDDEEEEGVYENEPEARQGDIMSEADKNMEERLPAAGTAQNLKAKFLSQVQEAESSSPRNKREITPPNLTQGGGEYVSEPRSQFEHYEGKAESGVFESQPVYDEEVVRGDSMQADAIPEQGTAKNMAARFKQLESERSVAVTSTKREITPDRNSSRVEYVSEPRGTFEHFEGKAESGVFESEPCANPDVVRSGEGYVENLPERGTAKHMASRFQQISEESNIPKVSRVRREITPDTNSRVEYVSEPRYQHEAYDVKVDAGVFENQPYEDGDVVKAETQVEEYVPERGFTKNVAAKFKELESTAKSPPLSPGRRKEFTPPRDDAGNRHAAAAGVCESTPQFNPEVVTSEEMPEEVLPERGMAKNLAQRFHRIEAESRSPDTSKPKKEFTPPPQDSGVYENKPDQFHADYNRPAESGILENKPMEQHEDVAKAHDGPMDTEELPECGSARNLLSRWKQMESKSNTSPGSTVRQKEFTPPREEPRIAQQSRSPLTPKSPPAHAQMDNGSVHPSELPGQYQPQNEPHVFESMPEQSDAARESDTDWSKGMPKKNQAKKMLARFQSIQKEANAETPKPVARKDSESESSASDPAMQNARLKFEAPDQVGRSKSMKAAIQVEKCGACDKTVYAMERLEMNKRVYHRACFRCSKCKSVLTAKTFSINNDVIFCTTHYKQLFTRKGNYDEGFGRTQHKKRWSSQPNVNDDQEEAEASKS